jgi:hypothetical protein
MAFIKTVSFCSAFLYPNGDKQSGRVKLYCSPSCLTNNYWLPILDSKMAENTMK